MIRNVVTMTPALKNNIPESKSFMNALSKESSPYLQQHANNPVNWYPWNEASLALAKSENKPILLSIGYSACHWCHVMAHESFENEKIATIMNQYFINIKVDREERPDLDKIYQASYQIMFNRPGGWPLTMFLSPDDHLPFYAGTYFPAKENYQRPAFPQLLQQLSAFYHNQQDKINVSKAQIKQALESYIQTPENDQQPTLSARPFDAIRANLEEAFNTEHGGFGQTPKFPQFTSLECLMHHQHIISRQANEDPTGLEMVLYSLKKMASGGVYDHLAGGICRYSVDDYWMIPHFEKMLYDNGPLLSVYTDAWQMTSQNLLQKEQNNQNDDSQSRTIELEQYSRLFKHTIEQTGDWLIREMQSSEGGFYSSLDADTEGQEGKFYVWDKQEIKKILQIDDNLYPIFAAHYGLDQKSNFEGLWNLHIYQDRQYLSEHFNHPLEQIDRLLEKSRALLLEQREKRVKPGRDEKILTSWNGLMIKGLAKAGRQLKRDDYIQAAEKALDFIKKHCWVDGHLFATYKNGQARLDAYLDDYAFLLDAILELLQSHWRTEDMNFAIQLADILLDKFEDKKHGGFFFTAHDHEKLITRPKSFEDESIPSGNAMASYALGRLGHILGKFTYIKASERTLYAGWHFLQQIPVGHASLFLTLEDMLFPPKIIILRGESHAIKEWQALCQKYYSPNQLSLMIDNEQFNLPGGLEKKEIHSSAVAYICSSFECKKPIISLDELVIAVMG